MSTQSSRPSLHHYNTNRSPMNNFWKERPTPPHPPLHHHHHHHHHNSNFHYHNQTHRPNFIVELRTGRRGYNKVELQGLLNSCPQKPERVFFLNGLIAARLTYQQWSSALEAIVFFWDRRLNEPRRHLYNPQVISNVFVPSDKDEMRNRLKTLFASFLRGLLDGEKVRFWVKKMEILSDEIANVQSKLKRRYNPLVTFEELSKKKEGLIAERELISKKLKEFKAAMGCVLLHLEDLQPRDSVNEGVTFEVQVLRFENKFDWCRIHHIVLRECRRLEDGLPIYAFRREIMQKIHGQQASVLIGETGSGKSTQLVQFLADTGLDGNHSIICTQPRKIAALSLAQRVQEESNGCYEDNSVICYPWFSSAQVFESKVIFMTDHCLLQHYMNDKTLAGISYIIVDEAHERSLNTDLLLALLKGLLLERLDLRLVIMSATADARKLSDYFFGCGTYHVVGRNFPVEIKYVPNASGEYSATGRLKSGNCASYVSDVVKMVTEVHEREQAGAILAFLTSQIEVEWACENFQSLNAIALPLHGKLSSEEQGRVFLKYLGQRKVIFSTNLAETSLTIPEVKYVVDCGMVKESRFEPSTGMNLLRVCRVSQSSANQRAGRAGRTEPGKCYRLYSEFDFESMASHQEPEIHKVHLGVAILRILALGIKNVEDFDFVDAPSPDAVEMAIKNLIQLGAITPRSSCFELTQNGRYLVKMGIEPRLGKLILDSFDYQLRREGLVLAAVMANASSIFCRIGNDEDKLKSDRLKVHFCHRDGDLFTLLSVYKQWEEVLSDDQGKWCWNNSINAKSMRRCKEAVLELEHCLKNELNIIIPSYWYWNPNKPSEHDKHLKKVILASHAENLAMYSGYDRLGYQVALTKQHVQLHPSCSLLIYSQKPDWVVFGELLSVTNQYLACVTAIDYDCLSDISPSLILEMKNQKLQTTVITGYGSTLLKRFCGKGNNNLFRLVSRIQNEFKNERIGIEVEIGKNEVHLFSSSVDMEKVSALVNDVLRYEVKWLSDECVEKCLYRGGPSISPSIALFGAGAEIKHLELDKRYLTVEVFHSNVQALDDKELLMMFEKFASGICSFYRHAGIGNEGKSSEKWGRITFLTPEAAEKAVVQLNEIEVSGALLKVVPSRPAFTGDRAFTFPAVKAKVSWPRRYSKGVAIAKCARQDVDNVIHDSSDLIIGGRFVHCENSRKEADCVVIGGLDRETSEAEILDALRTATNGRVFEVFLVRGDAVKDPPYSSCEELLLREIAPFMPSKNPLGNYCHVQVFSSEAKDYSMKAMITFDGRLHLEAAKALEHLEGKVLAGCQSWQKIRCQHMFYSSISCPAHVYHVIKQQLESLFASFKRRNGVYNIERNENGSYRVKIQANATKTVADMRKPLEEIMKGKTITDASFTPSKLQLLLSRDGVMLMKKLERETGTCILYDRQNLNVRIFGPDDKVGVAEHRLVLSLMILDESKQHEILLRGKDLPHNLMKEVVEKFGPELHGLKEKVPDADVTLNTRRHALLVRGFKESRKQVEEMIYEMARSLGDGDPDEVADGETCSICLCEVEDCHQLEACSHRFCRSCLIEQLESATRTREGFPICCTREGCGKHIQLMDLKSLLSNEKLEDLFRASLGAFVASSGGTYRFCPSPDCPSVYQVAKPGTVGEPFMCGACCMETCTRCHLEFHSGMSCVRYKEFKEDPDLSLKVWCKGKEQVKVCPMCGYTIEKIDGCNHIECKCGKHICWVCLECFSSSDDCYGHLRSIHQTII